MELRRLNFRWSLLILFTIVVGGTIGIHVRAERHLKARAVFHDAVLTGDIETAKWCLDVDPSLVNYPFDFGPPIVLANFSDRAAMVELILTRGGERATFEGMVSCDPRIARLLLDAGADVTGGNEEYERTWLHWVCPVFRSTITPGNVATARMLIEAGADVNARDPSGSTPLHELLSNYSGDPYSASQQRIALAKLLMDSGADIDAKDDLGETPKQRASSTGMAGLEELWEYAERVPRTK